MTTLAQVDIIFIWYQIKSDPNDPQINLAGEHYDEQYTTHLFGNSSTEEDAMYHIQNRHDLPREAFTNISIER